MATGGFRFAALRGEARGGRFENREEFGLRGRGFPCAARGEADGAGGPAGGDGKFGEEAARGFGAGLSGRDAAQQFGAVEKFAHEEDRACLDEGGGRAEIGKEVFELFARRGATAGHDPAAAVEVFFADCGCTDERVVVSGEDGEVVCEEGFLCDIADGGGIAEGTEDEVDFAAPEAAQKLVIGAVANLDGIGGAVFAKGGDDFRQENRARERQGADGEAADFFAGKRGKLGFGLIEFGHGEAGALGKGFGAAGGDHAEGGAFEEDAARLLFELGDGAVDGGLSEAEAAGGEGEVLGFADGGEGLQLRQRGGEGQAGGDFGQSRVELGEGAFGAVGEDGAARGGEEALTGAFEKCAARGGFQFGDGLGDSGLGDEAARGGGGDGACVHHGHKEAEVAQVARDMERRWHGGSSLQFRGGCQSGPSG
jgi:hypothetical protein